MASLTELADFRARHGSVRPTLETAETDGLRLDELERVNTQLREEIDELRREGRYVAELYDLVLERVRADAKS
jgi:hypothetical protein